jgi:hypothetical protein
MLPPSDSRGCPVDLTQRLRGRQVAAVMTNGNVLAIRCEDGSEILVAWVDENGDPIKGRPVVTGRGLRLRAEGMQDIIASPQRHPSINRSAA